MKHLKQWASVFSATCGFRNHCIKEWLREVKGDKHKARCIVCGMKDVDISSMGESAHKSLEKKKASNTDTPEKVISKRSRFFWRFFSTTSNYKVVSKSASSESGEHMLKGQMNQNFEFSFF